MTKMILKGYENNPQKYAQHIHDLNYYKENRDGTLPLKGIEAHPWSVCRMSKSVVKTTLAWMSFGYRDRFHLFIC